jgi:hypothetical protein
MNRIFDLSDILTITTGKLVSTRGMEAVYDILNYMTGEQLFTHQLPRAMRVCGPALLKQHPQLRDVVADGVDGSNCRAWMEQQRKKHVDFLLIEPLGPGEYTAQDPILELAEMRKGNP